MFGQDPNKILSQGYAGTIPGINQATQQAIGYVSPYQQIGTQATGDLYSHLQGMQDPQGYLSKILGGYTESPWAKTEAKAGTDALMNQQAALGLTGSGQEAKDVMSFNQGLASKDMQNYLNNILGINQSYLGGMRGLSGMGLQAGMGMGREQMQGAEDVAEMQAAKAKADAEAAKNKQSWWGAALGGLGAALPHIL